MTFRLLTLLGCIALANQPAAAQRLEWPPQPSLAEPWPETSVVPAGQPAISQHRVAVGAREVPVKATVQILAFDQKDGTRDAIVSTTSYLRDGLKSGERAKRPVVFAFNGGPGGSSVWLHLGLLGPQILPVPGDPKTPIPADGKLVPNPDPILDIADVVIIDMVGSGFGQLLNHDAEKYYYSTPGDGAYFSDVIRHWLAANGRQDSPVLLMGESYGSVRAAVVAADLTCAAKENCRPVKLQGVALLSQVLSSTREELTKAIDLPSLAGVACYHRKVACNGESEQYMAKAYRFAVDEYLPALVKGAALTPDERAGIARRLGEFTGLEPDFFLKNDLYVDREEYRGLLFASTNEVVGRFDGRFLRKRTQKGANDPSFDELNAGLIAGAERFYAEDLGYRGELPFSIFVREAPFEWRYSRISVPWTNFNWYRFLDAAAVKNPGLKVMMVGGFYDGATGYGIDRYVLDHWKIAPANLFQRHYEGGHMFYMEVKTRHPFVTDLRNFIAWSVEGGERPERS